MKRILTRTILVFTAAAVLQGCFSPLIRKYYFPQVGMYMTITFKDGYGYAIFSRDSSVTTISEDVDYIRMRPLEQASVSLLLNPECTDIVYVNDSWDIADINSKDLTFIRIGTDSTFYYSQEFPNAPDADWARPEYYAITIMGSMNGVVHKETGENKEYTFAKPFFGDVHL